MVLDVGLGLVVDLGVPERHAVVGGALEDGEVADIFGDLGDDLDGGGTGADDADLLADHIDAFLGPAVGVGRDALVALQSLEVGDVAGGEDADGRDDELGAGLVAVIGGGDPAVGVHVVHQRGDA